MNSDSKLCYSSGNVYCNFTDADGEEDGNDKKCVQNSRRRVAHTVAEQKRRDAIKVNKYIINSTIRLHYFRA